MTHVVPVDDLYEHELTGACACDPIVEVCGDGFRVIHNSYNGREAAEESKAAIEHEEAE